MVIPERIRKMEKASVFATEKNLLTAEIIHNTVIKKTCVKKNYV